MTPEDTRAWAAVWQRAAPLLEAERVERAIRCSIAEAIAALDDAFESALAAAIPRAETGLVAQQQLFSRLR